MSKRFKDFGSGIGEKRDAIVFKLHDEEFSCVPELPGKTLLRLISGTTSEDTEKVYKSIEGFFEACLDDDSKERFMNLLEDRKRVVSVETMAEIASWLVEEYSGTPTKGSEV